MWLPRMLDKARAHLAGTRGEYIFNCAMDSRLLQFLNLQPDAVLEAVKAGGDDNAVFERLKKGISPRSAAAIEEFNTMLSSLAPTTPDNIRKFEATRDKIAPGRKDIRTWTDLLDLEEGRIE